jgi:hypothetical protein
MRDFPDYFPDEEVEEEPKVDETAHLPVKGAYCPLCKGIMLLSAMPQAETNKDSIKQFRTAALEGYEIKILPKVEATAPHWCKCGGPPDLPKVKRPRKPKS